MCNHIQIAVSSHIVKITLPQGNKKTVSKKSYMEEIKQWSRTFQRRSSWVSFSFAFLSFSISCLLLSSSLLSSIFFLKFFNPFSLLVCFMYQKYPWSDWEKTQTVTSSKISFLKSDSSSLVVHFSDWWLLWHLFTQPNPPLCTLLCVLTVPCETCLYLQI